MKVVGRRGRGQALVEFALALPVFLVLILALFDFARLLFAYVSLANGARELTRSLAVPTSSNTTALGAFSNLTIMTSSVSNTTDTVTITVTPAAGTATSVVCYLGATSGGVGLVTQGTTTACTLPSRTGADGGTVNVAVNYHFQFSPIFQAPLGVAFAPGATSLTTTSVGYVE